MGINYEQMTEIYNSINELIKDMMNAIKDSKSVVNKLNDKDYWDGNGYDHYQELYSNLCTNFVAFCDHMYFVNTNIMDSISRYKEIDKQVMETIGYGR